MSNKIQIVKNKIIQELKKQGNPERIEAMNNYLKFKVDNRGNSNPIIIKTYRDIKNNNELYNSLTNDEKYLLGTQLLKNNFIDDKMIASSILSEIHKSYDSSKLAELRLLIKQGHINEWASADTFAAKICRPYSLQSKDKSLEIAEWRYDDNIWVRRISCVTFITRIKKKDNHPNFTGFIDLMFEICEENIKYPERFNQLGTGWLLRELSLVDYENFDKFFYKNFEYFSREGIRYAIEKLSEVQRKKYLTYRGKEHIDMLNKERPKSTKRKNK
jgi:3-methyladenine DNA glycosylase AlkD